MDTNKPLLDTIEPDVMDHLVSRRKAIRQGATASAALVAGMKFASVPLALAALSREAGAQTTSVQGVIDFALALEIFENEFYKAVLGTSASPAQNAAFATVRALALGAGAVPALQQIQKHEQAHVDFLTSQGAKNVFNLSATTFDFTGNRSASGGGPFARATTELPFLLLVAQAAEDTGVRAYKGQAPNLISNDAVLEAALRIHSVEARHAAKIRRLRRTTGAPASVRFSGTVSGSGAEAAGAGNIANPPAAVVAALGLIYGGATPEGNTMQGGVNVATVSGSNLPATVNQSAAAQEAFDEPLTRAEVVTIVQPFFIPTIS